MKNIDVHNSEILENEEVKVTRSSKVGPIIALCIGLGAGAIGGFLLGTSDDIEILDYSTPPGIEINAETPLRDQVFVSDDETIVPYEQEDPINVSLEEINSLNIIINDNDCREDFINKVYKTPKSLYA